MMTEEQLKQARTWIERVGVLFADAVSAAYRTMPNAGIFADELKDRLDCYRYSVGRVGKALTLSEEIESVGGDIRRIGCIFEDAAADVTAEQEDGATGRHPDTPEHDA